MTEPIHVRARKFLQEFFNDEDLTNFCFDYFPQVYNDFSQGMSKSQKVRMLVENSRRRGRFDELLAALERERPKSYPDHFAEKPHLAEAEPQIPKTIKRNPRQVFISHAHQDAEFAQRLATDLQANHWDTWMAPDDIRPGEKWVEAINRGLSKSGVFVLVMTPAAVDSRWVQSETNVAIGMEHRGELRLLPLNLKPVSVPPLWQAYQWISFESDYKEGMHNLLSLLMSKPAEEPGEDDFISSHSTKQLYQAEVANDAILVDLYVPLGRFRSRYNYRSKYYDDSFPLDSDKEEFLGECGVGIAHSIDDGSSKNIIAFEVWLFDKNDAKTKTKLILSEYAYFDEAIRKKLALKGELFLARNKQVIVLDSESIIINAEIQEVEYWKNRRLLQGFFSHFSIHLSVWSKSRLWTESRLKTSKSILLHKFQSRYDFGDDNYDHSFSIESMGGEFLGECGVGIIHSINVISSKNVTAFEFWFFDKNELRTKTKLILSDFAFFNIDIRKELAPKGEAYLAQKKKTIILESEEITINAEIKELEYLVASQILPEKGYFKHFSIELIVAQILK